ncbi:unnamed protein product [Knipowitschia caucasica]|uniref:Uncharacterized protein n=1 Tax=Knipowitschia caucasica TaxID=637954 RepID=A0AAV2JTB5_KNICA
MTDEHCECSLSCSSSTAPPRCDNLLEPHADHSSPGVLCSCRPYWSLHEPLTHFPLAADVSKVPGHLSFLQCIKKTLNATLTCHLAPGHGRSLNRRLRHHSL